MKPVILVLLIFAISVLSDSPDSNEDIGYSNDSTSGKNESIYITDIANNTEQVGISNSLNSNDSTPQRNESSHERTQTNIASWRRNQRPRSRQRQGGRQTPLMGTDPLRTNPQRHSDPQRQTPRWRSRPRPRHNSRRRHWRRNRRPYRHQTNTRTNSSHVNPVTSNTDPLGRPLGHSSNSVGSNLVAVESTSTVPGRNDVQGAARSPFQNRQTAHDFLSSNVHTRVRHNERMSENRALNALMAESMCEVFNKHFYQNALGGRCL